MPRIYIRKCDDMVLRTAKKGSVTIEAAVVLPLAVIAILTMILFVFYMCDVITVRAKAEAYTMSIFSFTIAPAFIRVRLLIIPEVLRLDSTKMTLQICFSLCLLLLNKQELLSGISQL